MAHHSLRRAPGNWIGVATQQDYEFFDLMQFRSIDGDTGGTWNPSAWIMLGGNYGLRIGATAALQVDGNGSILGDVVVGSNSDNSFTCHSYASFGYQVHITGTLYPHGDINSDEDCDLCSSASNTFRVRGTGTFNENVTFDKAVTVSGVTTLNGNTVLGNAGTDTVTVNATTNVHANVDVKAGYDFGVSGNAYFNGDTRINGLGGSCTTTIEGGEFIVNTAITLGTSGFIAYRRLVAGAGATVSIQNYDMVKIPESGAVFLSDYGDNGAIIRIINASSGTLTVRTVDDSHILRTLPAHTWADFMRDSTWGAYGWSIWGEGTHTEAV